MNESMVRSFQVRLLPSADRPLSLTKRYLIRYVTGLVVGLMIVPCLPNAAFAHGTLRSAAPGDGDRLLVAPSELRLTFTEAVEVAIARLTLTGPDGNVELAPLALHPDSATVLIAAIQGPLVVGAYNVQWQMVGADGHPVRGEYSFVIEAGAQGLTTAEPASAVAASLDASTAEQSGNAVRTEPTGSSALVWLIIGGVLAVFAVVGIKLFGRRPDSEAGGEHV